MVSPVLREECNLNPIADGEVVEFRLLRANQVDPSSTKRVRTPAGHYLAPQTTIIDPGQQNRRIIIQNITGWDLVYTENGGSYYKPMLEYFKFGSTGSMFLKAGDEDQLYFGRLHSKNKSNPHRDKSKPEIFYEVDEKKEISLKNNFFDYKAMAYGYMSEVGYDEQSLTEVAQTIQSAHRGRYIYTLGMGSEILRNQVMHTVDSQPIDFLISVKEKKSFTRLVVDHAEAARVILFDNHPNQMTWSYRRIAGVNANKTAVTILKCSSQKAAKKELIEYLLDESGKGNKDLMHLTKIFEDYYKL